MNHFTSDSHGLFLAAALAACALALALEVWWLRREAQLAAKEVLMSDGSGEEAVREPVLTHRNPAAARGCSQEASA